MFKVAPSFGHLWTCPWFHVFFKSPSCTESVTSRWTAKRLPVCAMQCETLVVDKASARGLSKAESPSPTLDVRGFPGYDSYSELYHLTKNFSAFLKLSLLSFRSCKIYYVLSPLLPGCVCIFLLDLSGSRKLWVFLYLTNSQVCRWVQSHRSGPHVQNVDVSNTEGRRFSWRPWHPTHHYSPGNWS